LPESDKAWFNEAQEKEAKERAERNRIAEENAERIRKESIQKAADEAAEKAKHELSTTSEAEINIPFITSNADGPKHLLMKMTRAQLEKLAQEFVDRSMEITKRCLEASGFAKNEIQEVIMVGGQTRMPLIVDAVKNFFGKEPNRSINPDEVVALGAAVQAGVLQGDVKDILLLDVIPLSFGIETMGGVMTKLIEKNTTIPTQATQIFSTASDNQTSVQVNVLQGERPMAADNKLLGTFHLDGIPPAPRGTPQVEITLDIDANGILNVKAKEKTTGKEQSIRIEASSGLTKEEIEKMKRDAEINAETDKKKKDLVDAKNIAEQTIHVAEKAIKDAGDKISPETKTSVEEAIKNLNEVKTKDDETKIKTATENLSTVMQKIGEEMQKNAGTQTPKEGDTPEGEQKA
jgi:molecular chaperone DnaK